LHDNLATVANIPSVGIEEVVQVLCAGVLRKEWHAEGREGNLNGIDISIIKNLFGVVKAFSLSSPYLKTF
jgi:hypothetical protein